MTFKKILLIIFLFGFMPFSHGFALPLLGRITAPMFLQGFVNNGILAWMYYYFLPKKEEIKLATAEFVKEAKPWDTAPELIKKYNPHVFNAVDYEENEALQWALIDLSHPRFIDGKVYIDRKLLWAYQQEKMSEQALIAAIRFEYERKEFFPDADTYKPETFLQGVLQYIGLKFAIKKGGTILIPPVTRRNLNFKVQNASFYAFSTLADLFLKYKVGRRILEEKDRNRFLESHFEILEMWKDDPKMSVYLEGYCEYMEYWQKTMQKKS